MLLKCLGSDRCACAWRVRGQGRLDVDGKGHFEGVQVCASVLVTCTERSCSSRPPVTSKKVYGMSGHVP
eukprot:413501-Pyramimonas_sp.AAC.1